MSLGETIKTLRNGKNMSQNELAEALGVSRQSVSKWETDGAVPELDKLVGMSDIFGVTLDVLVKGSAPDEGETAQPRADTRREERGRGSVTGVILLCTGAVILLVLLVLGGGLFSLICASPFLLCGAVCLLTRRRTALWCGWTVFVCVDLYLRYATGITWSIIRFTAQFTPEMNYMRLATGWVMFLAGALLFILTVRSYRSLRLERSARRLVLSAAGWAVLVGASFAQSAAMRHVLGLPLGQAREAAYFWLSACGDLARFALFAVLVITGAALLLKRPARNA